MKSPPDGGGYGVPVGRILKTLLGKTRRVFQSVKEHSVKLSRNGIIYATVEKASKKAEKVRAIPAPCC